MALIVDAQGRPLPQHFQDDGITEERLHGRNNAAYSTLKDDAGNVVDTTNRLPTDSVLSGSTIPDSESLPVKQVGRVQQLANAVAVVAGASWTSDILDFTGKHYGAAYVQFDQNHDVKIKPYGTSGGTPATMTDITVAAGLTSSASFRGSNAASAIQQVIYGKWRVDNTSATDGTVSVWEVVK